jgi:hypothetical protein
MTPKTKLLELVHTFDAAYANETLQRIQRATGDRLTMRLCRNPLLFPADRWNVYDATLTTSIRTNNECERWNNRFRQLVGPSHPSVWTAIEFTQMDQATASTAPLLFVRDQLPPTRICRNTVRHQKHLHSLCCRCCDDPQCTVDDFLSGIGHTIGLM